MKFSTGITNVNTLNKYCSFSDVRENVGQILRALTFNDAGKHGDVM